MTDTVELERLLSLPAGRELDYKVVKHVFGWPLKQNDRMTLDHASKPVPHFSTDIAAAWQVVEKLNCLQFLLSRENCAGVRFDASFYNQLDTGDIVTETADTLPLAICRAALRAKLEVSDGR